MHSKLFAIVLTIAVACSPSAYADLLDVFAGFDAVWEVGASGLESSYYADTAAGLPVTGPTTDNFLHELGPSHVCYPSGVGEVPSPGGSLGQNFDQGVLGIKLDGDSLVIRLASALDPLEGFYHGGWNAWYGQGDLFLTVEDSNGISHYSLLNAWPRDELGAPRTLNGGHFDAAQAFHTSGGAGGASLEGHLIGLNTDADVTLTGGRGSYNASNAPSGLDQRAYAEGGTDLGDAGLVHESLSDYDQDWYLQTWTISLHTLSPDPAFDIGLHAISSCGNDQIGSLATVPEPGSIVLLVIGVGFYLRVRCHG
jgi:hypothetical protein